MDAPGPQRVPEHLRIAGLVVRAIFIVCLLVLTVRVSLPQSETLWTVYDTPGDVVRLILGFAVGVAILFQLFTVPRDAQGYRIWLYLGLVGVPFVLLCIFAFW